MRGEASTSRVVSAAGHPLVLEHREGRALWWCLICGQVRAVTTIDPPSRYRDSYLPPADRFRHL